MGGVGLCIPTILTCSLVSVDLLFTMHCKAVFHPAGCMYFSATVFVIHHVGTLYCGMFAGRSFVLCSQHQGRRSIFCW